MNYKELKKTWEYCRDELEKVQARYEELLDTHTKYKARTDKQLTEMAGLVTQTDKTNKTMKQAIQQLGEVIAHL